MKKISCILLILTLATACSHDNNLERSEGVLSDTQLTPLPSPDPYPTY
jgi:hypothetical protein